MNEGLRHEFEREGAFNEVFIVLTLGATLIATLGLLADSAAVVIGAMVVAPWILPLQAMAFEILEGRPARVARALRTLLFGVAITLVLAAVLGLLVAFPSFGREVLNRTSPNLLDLGIALVAGAMAMYAKLRREAISALAGLAIAVALVPPVCVVGLLLSARQWQQAYGAGLLFTTNLLGILVGAMAVLGGLEPGYRQRLLHSRLGLISLALTLLLVIPLGGSFLQLLGQSRQDVAVQQVQDTIRRSLRQRFEGLGRQSELVGVAIDWTRNPPLIRASVRVSDPRVPTAAQVAALQKVINAQQAPRRFRLVMQRIAIDVIGPETAPNPPDLPALPQPLPGVAPLIPRSDQGDGVSPPPPPPPPPSLPPPPPPPPPG
ncbi:MAG: DUF389 domain-containing protein [Cyanobacteriota bacterium]|nr:DUF389 domain-containing protein [Cyanobacteriota bacterium]